MSELKNALKITEQDGEAVRKIKELQKLSEPIMEYLSKSFAPYGTVIITETHVRLVRDEIRIPRQKRASGQPPLCGGRKENEV